MERMVNFDWPTGLLVFVFMVITDILNAYYVRRVSSGSALQAGLLSMSITLVAAVVTINYVENKIYLIPTALGALVGTYLSVKIDSRKKNL